MTIARNRERGSDPDSWQLWSSDLSPFALKVDALLDYAEWPHRWLPAEGTRLEGIRAHRRVGRIQKRKLALTHPPLDELDEFPLVPFLFGPGGENLYDSSAIGEWIDSQGGVTRAGAGALLPAKDPALRFAVRLVDEYFDEFGLYMVHHNRWVVAARDNGAGRRLADDFRPVLGVGAHLLSRFFPSRQVRRLPYLFSVAPEGGNFSDLPRRLRPPTRSGFPATHQLLEDCFSRLLRILENRLAQHPFLFGGQLTLADASAYGQLGMNLSDKSAEAWIRRDAPNLRAWLGRIAHADFGVPAERPVAQLDAGLAPLLSECCSTLVPLLQQNRDAWEHHRSKGIAIFNERAFDAGRALYDGVLHGAPYRAVAKTFQVRVWRDLRAQWQALVPAERARLEELLPPDHGLDRDGFDTAK